MKAILLMGSESSKANRRRVCDPFWQRVFVGRGIDIGAGDDPVVREGRWPNVMSCEDFDCGQGDANYMLRYCEPAAYDFVYSSHCLEHLYDPHRAIREWWALVKPGGHLVVVVPDEDLYEQGVWPSRFNADHKWTFTVFKAQGQGMSWSPRSINVLSLITDNLSTSRVMLLRVADTGYDYNLRHVDQTLPPFEAEAAIEVVVRKLDDSTSPRAY